MTNLQQENISIRCADGVVLGGLLLIPKSPIQGIIQFNNGTAVKKEYYLPFLRYMCQNGYICCLWDYRGSGSSRPDTLKNCAYRFRDYGIQDIPAINHYLVERFPTYPLIMVGHSTGGQQIGFSENLSRIDGLVAIAVSTGYMRHMPFRYRLRSYFFFYLFTPLSIGYYGYLRAKKFGFMEDLPKDVVREWRDWCGKPAYFFDPKFYGQTVPIGTFERYNFPVHVFSTNDDPISNRHSVAMFWKHIKSTKPIVFHTITPAEYGVKEIAHLGFFRKEHEKQLWPNILNAINACLTPTAPQNTTN